MFVNVVVGFSDENNFFVEGFLFFGFVVCLVVGGLFCEEFVGRVGGVNKIKG